MKLIFLNFLFFPRGENDLRGEETRRRKKYFIDNFSRYFCDFVSSKIFVTLGIKIEWEPRGNGDCVSLKTEVLLLPLIYLISFID